jgi:hypothetical protein
VRGVGVCVCVCMCVGHTHTPTNQPHTRDTALTHSLAHSLTRTGVTVTHRQRGYEYIEYLLKISFIPAALSAFSLSSLIASATSFRS